MRPIGSTSTPPAVPGSIEACASLVSAAITQARPVMLCCVPTLEGVLSATGITYLAHAHAGQLRLASSRRLQPQLGEEVIKAPSPYDDATVAFARRVLVGFSRKVTAGCRRRRAHGGCPPTCDNACVRRLLLVTASDDPAMPEVVHQYLRLGFAVGRTVRHMLSDPRVAAFNDLARSVSSECEHTRQFVRFSHLSDDSYVASFTPKANTIPLTADHFAARMRGERFYVVDPRHRVAALHERDERHCSIERLDEALARDLAQRRDFADDEPYVRALWRHFYQRTALPGRGPDQRGYDLRTHWMPQRFWDGLTELDPSDIKAGTATPKAVRLPVHKEAAPLL